MADAKELGKLNRTQLNELAAKHGIEDAANEEKYVTKADLIGELQSKVTPEEVEAARTGVTEAPQEAEDGTSSEGVESGETAPTEPETVPADQPAPPAIDSADDVDDQSGTEKAPTKEEVEEEADEEVVTPNVAGAPPVDEPGMGFPMNKEGQTVDLFDGKTVHTHVRNVGGVMVPLSQKSYETKTDAQILEKLKKMGKL